MPSVLITGASRGLGYAFVSYFASRSDWTVLGLARNKEATEARLAKDGIEGVIIVQSDITDSRSVQKAADETSKVTGGSLDLLINNAGFVSEISAFKLLSDFEPAVLEEELKSSFNANVVGVAHTINAFLPLIRKGNGKKIITLSTGLADDKLTNNFSIGISAPYSISKAAVNTLVAKYNASFGKSDGILFMGISPGVVDTSEGKQPTEEEMAGMQAMGAAFANYAPNFKGPITADESVKMVMNVVDKSTVENAGGAFLSHFGNKQWL